MAGTPPLLSAAGAHESARPQTYTVEMIDPPPYFRPSELNIRVGDTVKWHNAGPEGIHIVSETGQSIFSGDVSIGTEWRHTFTRAGEYEIICGRHFFMRSRLTVRNADGSIKPRYEFPYQSAFREFAVPTRDGLPRMIINNRIGDTMWFTIGGGDFYGFEGIPPQNKLAEVDRNGVFVEFATPTPSGDGSSVGVDSLVMDKFGNVWFTERIANQIGKLTPDGEMTEYPLATEGGYALGVDIDRNGNVWFAERYGNRIGWITPNGEITEVEMPEPDSEPRTVFVASTGLVWYTARAANEIGYYDPKAQTFHRIKIPTQIARPAGIAETSDGTIYFVEMVGNKIGKVVGGRVVEFALPTPFAAPFKIVADADDKLWFTEVFGNAIGHFDPETGKIREFKIPTEDSRPGGIALDDDGNVWFTEQKGNKVAYIDLPELERITGERLVASVHRRDEAAPAAAARPKQTIQAHQTHAYDSVDVSAGGRKAPAAAPAPQVVAPLSTQSGAVSGSIGCCESTEQADSDPPWRLTAIEFSVPTPGGFPGNALAEDERGRIWFPEMFGNKIGVLDSKTGIVEEIALPEPVSMPTSVALDGEGNLWIAEFRGNRLARLNTRSLALKEFDLPREAALPSSVIVDEGGTVWLTELGANRIAAFDPKTETFAEYALPRPESSPLGIASDGDGKLWVSLTNEEYGQVARFDTRTKKFVLFDLPQGADSASGILVDGSKVWLALGGSGEVAAYDTETGGWRRYALPGEGAAPFQIALDRNGLIWITDGGGFGTDGANQIVALDPVTGRSRKLAIPQPRSKPSGILIGSDGAIWFTKKGTNTLARVVLTTTQ
ncbi:hypothetical protein [Sinorhizobium meliloti]|uniref:virginiamycin B lyase family protein n=1 Tax=Rhizobium meliloti TaxID=382 RepID=UPI00299ED229|nr:hypothetical protein [Sinorhizobium meliloti]MDX0283759.1 hypothetical protein [Sinorhizobium meliloti]